MVLFSGTKLLSKVAYNRGGISNRNTELSESTASSLASSYLSIQNELELNWESLRSIPPHLEFTHLSDQVAEALTLASQRWPRHAKLAQSSLAPVASTHGF